VVTVTGGKLTTYRRMASDAIDVVTGELGVKTRSATSRLALSGATGWDTSGLSDHLASRYGGNGTAVKALESERPELAQPIVPGLEYTKAEVVYAAREEMARSVDDVLSRRTRARLLARDASAAAAAEVARLIGPVIGWDDAAAAASIAEYHTLVDTERVSAALPETALDAALGT
jgi:glycerol-3-phosphate dehydrogenase